MNTKPTTDEKLLCTSWFVAAAMTLLMVISVIKLDNEFRGRRGRRARGRDDDIEMIEDLQPDPEVDTIYLIARKAS